MAYGKLPVDPTTFLNSQYVTTSQGIVHNEIVTLGDPNDPNGIAGVVNSQPSISAYGQIVRTAGNSSVYFANTTQQDAFSRLRVSTPQVLGFGQSEYGLNSNYMESVVAGTGAVTNVTADPSISLSTGGTASGAKSTVQTLVFHRYTPGRSQLVRWTTCFAAQKTNVRQRAGYFCNTGGLFIENDGTGWFFVRRVGSVDVQRVPRADWDDPLDGTGPSKISLDFTTTILWFVDLEWLGVGRFRFGCASPTTGELVPAYTNSGINLALTAPYIRTACLPVRFEIENTGTASSTTAMKAICYSVDTEGGDEGRIPIQVGADNGGTAINLNNGTTGGAYKPILSIRPSTTGPNGVTNRGQIVLTDYSVLVTGAAPVSLRIFLNATLTGPLWTARGAISEFDVTATALTGGTRLGSDYVASGSSKTNGSVTTADFFRKLPLTYTELNSTQTTLTIAGVGITNPSSATAAVNWQELY